MFIFLSLKTKSIRLIYFYLKDFFFKYDQYIFIILKQSIKKKKKKITVLKSPHIDKKSKESFDFCTYRLNILFYIFDLNLFIYLLNKIKNNILLDLQIKILLLYSSNIIVFENLNEFLIKNHMKSKYLKLLDIIGEISLKNSLSK